MSPSWGDGAAFTGAADAGWVKGPGSGWTFTRDRSSRARSTRARGDPHLAARARTSRSWTGCSVAACDEAEPTGVRVGAALRAAGVACEVVAPSKVERPARDEVKTDRRDAERLARLLRMGEVRRSPGICRCSNAWTGRARPEARRAPPAPGFEQPGPVGRAGGGWISGSHDLDSDRTDAYFRSMSHYKVSSHDTHCGPAAASLGDVLRSARVLPILRSASATEAPRACRGPRRGGPPSGGADNDDPGMAGRARRDRRRLPRTVARSGHGPRSGRRAPRRGPRRAFPRDALALTGRPCHRGRRRGGARRGRSDSW